MAQLPASDMLSVTSLGTSGAWVRFCDSSISKEVWFGLDYTQGEIYQCSMLNLIFLANAVFLVAYRI